MCDPVCRSAPGKDFWKVVSGMALWYSKRQMETHYATERMRTNAKETNALCPADGGAAGNGLFWQRSAGQSGYSGVA